MPISEYETHIGETDTKPGNKPDLLLSSAFSMHTIVGLQASELCCP